MKKNFFTVRKKKGNKGVMFALVSLLAGILLFVFLVRLEEISLENYQTKNVIIATKEIPSGVQISGQDLNKYFRCVQANKENSVDSFSSMEQLLEWTDKKGSIFSAENIKKNEIIYAEKFVNVEEISLDYERPIEVGVKVNSYEYCMGGTLRTGNIVDLSIINTDIGSEILLENVLILKSFDANGIEISPEDEQTVCVGFNIMIEQSDFENYNSALENGTVRLTKKI